MLSRTHVCGSLGEEHVGRTVVLNGWAQRRRDLGGVLFIDLRDRSGIVQIVFNPAFSGEALAVADRVRSEYVLAVKGKIVLRDAETVNRTLQPAKSKCRLRKSKF